jgi:hypothetical protein
MMRMHQITERDKFEFGVEDESYLDVSIVVRGAKTVAEARKMAEGFCSLVTGPRFDLDFSPTPNPKRRVRKARSKSTG